MSVGADKQHRERRERLTPRIVGASFLALAGYVAYEAIADLATRSAPEVSRVGIALAAGPMQADATQTEFCMYLSGLLLASAGNFTALVKDFPCRSGR
jgi:hypothetical protein